MADQGFRDPSSVVKQARLISDRDFQEFCQRTLGILRGRERGSECTSCLRRLFLLVAVTRSRKRIPAELTEELKNVVCEPQQGSKKIKLLCSAILWEITPTMQLEITSLDPPVEQRNIPLIFPVIMAQGKDFGNFNIHVPQILKWLTGGNVPIELRTMALGSLQLLMQFYSEEIPEEEKSKISLQLAQWLRNASIVSAPNPYQRQIFGGSSAKGYQPVAEIDGTTSRYFFTVLSIAHYFFSDQVLNVHSFSLLRYWLKYVKVSKNGTSSPQGTPLPGTAGSRSTSMENLNQSPVRLGTPEPHDHLLSRSQSSMDNVSIDSQSSAGFIIPLSQSSPHRTRNFSPSPVLGWSPADQPVFTGDGSCPQTSLSFLEESTERSRSQAQSRGVPSRRISSVTSFSKLFPHQQGQRSGFTELKEKACEYCLRLIEQSERKPSKSQDITVLEACVVEAVGTLDVLCSGDKSLVPKLIEIIRRLYARVSGDVNKWKRVLPPVVQFFLNHGDAVVFDPEPACAMLFGPVITTYYNSSSFAFDIVTFCRQNMEKLCLSTNVFSRQFPNLLKILAWFPRTYVKEYLELLPVMIDQDSTVEIFHTLLDLPCLSAAMTVSWASRVRSGELAGPPATSVDSFMNPQNKAIFSFILRQQAGHGDTIDKLSKLHVLLQDMVDHPRVMVCSQIVLPLLSIFFKVVLEHADVNTVSRLVPAMLERVGMIYPVQDYFQGIRRFLSEKLLEIFGQYPEFVVTHHQDMMDFVAGLKNVGPDKEEFFAHLVWVIGEYASTAYNSHCPVQLIVQYFESLEALTYEIITYSASKKVTFSGRVISSLLASLAKLASRCQDLIQRAILCISKVVRQKSEMLSDQESFPALLTRAKELINVLKLPNVAPVILSPDAELHTGRWHRDRNSSLPLLLQASKVAMSS